MRLYFVRHGQTDFNLGNVLYGIMDVPLNDTGKAQAQELAKEIRGMEFDAYYVSPMLRARQTAALITEGRAEFTVDELLHERDYGDLEGQQVNVYDLVGNVFDLRANLNTYNIEPIVDLMARAKRFLDKLKATHGPDDRILIVAHNALLRAIHFNIVGYDYDTNLREVTYDNCEMREYELLK